MNALVGQRQFHPYKVSIGCRIVTHLSYADDVVIFTSCLKSSLCLVMRVLEDYCAISGQKVNKQKSCFLVHSRLAPQRRRIFKQITRAPFGLAVLGVVFKKQHCSILFLSLRKSIFRLNTYDVHYLLVDGRRSTLWRFAGVFSTRFYLGNSEFYRLGEELCCSNMFYPLCRFIY